MDFTPSDPDRRRGPSRPAGPNAGVTVERTEADLHICPSCSSEFVQPVEWAPIDMRRWRVELECPDCAWTSVGFFPQQVLDRYDQILDQGAEALQDDLVRLERANMEADISTFVEALNSEQILPEDF